MSARTHVNSFEQKMLQGKEWNSFFDNIENKQDLLKLVVKFMKCNATNSQSIPVVINDEEDTWQITLNNTGKTRTTVQMQS